MYTVQCSLYYLSNTYNWHILFNIKEQRATFSTRKKKSNKRMIKNISINIDDSFGNIYLFSRSNDAVDVFQHKGKSFSIPQIKIFKCYISILRPSIWWSTIRDYPFCLQKARIKKKNDLNAITMSIMFFSSVLPRCSRFRESGVYLEQ